MMFRDLQTLLRTVRNYEHLQTQQAQIKTLSSAAGNFLGLITTRKAKTCKELCTHYILHPQVKEITNGVKYWLSIDSGT